MKTVSYAYSSAQFNKKPPLTISHPDRIIWVSTCRVIEMHYTPSHHLSSFGHFREPKKLSNSIPKIIYGPMVRAVGPPHYNITEPTDNLVNLSSMILA